MKRISKLVIAAGIAGVALIIGCSSDNTAGESLPIARSPMMVPAPLRDVPYEFSGKLGANWVGDTVELIEPSGIHCIRLIGVDCPENQQPKFQESRRLVSRMARNKPLTVRVIHRDEASVEYGRIIVDEKDLGLELVREGLAWFDGTEFEGSEEYSRAESEAREKKLAIWSDESPVAPWDFHEQQVARIRENTKATAESEPRGTAEQ